MGGWAGEGVGREGGREGGGMTPLLLFAFTLAITVRQQRENFVLSLFCFVLFCLVFLLRAQLCAVSLMGS